MENNSYKKDDEVCLKSFPDVRLVATHAEDEGGVNVRYWSSEGFKKDKFLASDLQPYEKPIIVAGRRY